MKVCGIDESGRGPLAGPVTAAAVILPERRPHATSAEEAYRLLFAALGDSKALTPQQRVKAALLIKTHARAWSVGWSWPGEIDRLNIHHATLLAMSRALSALYPQPDFVVVDGLFIPDCPIRAKAVVGGDRKVLAVMAASILAKTERDSWMTAYSKIESRYGFEVHKGYPTPQHRALIQRFGLCSIHRKSFRISFPG